MYIDKDALVFGNFLGKEVQNVEIFGNGYTAYIHNVRFENIRVEMNAFDTPEELQKSEDMEYSRAGEVALPRVLAVFNNRFAWAGSPVEKSAGDRIGERCAWVTDVLFKDITVYYDEGMPLSDGKPILGVYIENDRAQDGARFENIRIENLVCNGARVPCNAVDLHCKNADITEYK